MWGESMKEAISTLVSVGIGAFLAGTAFGYGLQQWNIKSVEQSEISAAFEQGQQAERELRGEAGDAATCREDGQVFTAEAGKIYRHCSTGTNFVLESVRDGNNAMQATVGALAISGRPPPYVARFVSKDEQQCELVYSAAVPSEPKSVIVSFNCG